MFVGNLSSLEKERETLQPWKCCDSHSNGGKCSPNHLRLTVLPFLYPMRNIFIFYSKLFKLYYNGGKVHILYFCWTDRWDKDLGLKPTYVTGCVRYILNIFRNQRMAVKEWYCVRTGQIVATICSQIEKSVVRFINLVSVRPQKLGWSSQLPDRQLFQIFHLLIHHRVAKHPDTSLEDANSPTQTFHSIQKCLRCHVLVYCHPTASFEGYYRMYT